MQIPSGVLPFSVKHHKSEGTMCITGDTLFVYPHLNDNGPGEGNN
jgi:hypothetical protein